jgi:hypothetical protein
MVRIMPASLGRGGIRDATPDQAAAGGARVAASAAIFGPAAARG